MISSISVKKEAVAHRRLGQNDAGAVSLGRCLIYLCQRDGALRLAARTDHPIRAC